MPLFRHFLLAFTLVSGTTASAKSIVIGVEEGAYFPHYDSDSGQYQGFGRELLDAYGVYAGVEITYKIQPLKRLVRSLINGTVDARYPDNPYWEPDLKRDLNIVYSNQIVTYIDGSFVTPEHAGKGIASLQSLGTVTGFTAWPYFDVIRSGDLYVQENSSRSGLLQQVILGRLDAAYMSVVVANHQLNYVMKRPDSLVFDPTLPYIKSHYYLSSIDNKALLDSFNAFLQEEAEQIKKLKLKLGVEEGLDSIPDYSP